MTNRFYKFTDALADNEICLFLGPRPGKKSLQKLTDLKLTHCCTLLSEREQVLPVRKISESLGCDWIWLPIDGGRLDILRHTDMEQHLRTFLKAVESEPHPRIYIHCSAGIHRTGFFVYMLLRVGGLTRERAREVLKDLREVTAEQVGEDRLDLADELAPSIM